MTVPYGESGRRTPRQRWGTCCPYDPECEHSFLDVDDLVRWMDTPIDDTAAKLVADLFGGAEVQA